MLPLVLQQERVDVNITDAQGYTASMLCVEWNRPQQLKMLLGRQGHDLAQTNCVSYLYLYGVRARIKGLHYVN